MVDSRDGQGTRCNRSIRVIRYRLKNHGDVCAHVVVKFGLCLFTGCEGQESLDDSERIIVEGVDGAEVSTIVDPGTRMYCVLISA